ncbi:MAG: hypothetical protein ABIG46_00740 [Candidatus Omnitrophota bacterium]|nr:hypothetical protein [Candidatus Omnitrophota bacterium]
MKRLSSKKHINFKIISWVLIFAFFISFTLPQKALAARSNAGGGEIAEFGFMDFAMGIVYSVGGSFVMSYIGSLVSGGSFSDFLDKVNFSSATDGYSTSVAASQVQRSVVAAGSYYEWDRRITYLAQGVAMGAASGFLQPNIAMGKEVTGISGTLKGVGVGAAGGLAKSGVTVLVAGDEIKKGERVGAIGQILGQIAGSFGTSVARGLMNDLTLGEAVSQYYESTLGVGKGGIQQRAAWKSLVVSSVGTLASESFAKDDEKKQAMIRGLVGSIASPLLDLATSKGTQPKDWGIYMARGIIQTAISTGINYAISSKFDVREKPGAYMLAGIGTAAGSAFAAYATSGLMGEDGQKKFKDTFSESILNTINSSISFGLPNEAAKDVSPSDWIGYVDRLNYLATLNNQYGFGTAIAFNVGDAYFSSAANNVMTALYGATQSPYFMPRQDVTAADPSKGRSSVQNPLLQPSVDKPTPTSGTILEE